MTHYLPKDETQKTSHIMSTDCPCKPVLRGVFWAYVNGSPNASFRHETRVHGWMGGWNPDACLIRGPIADCAFAFPSPANPLPNPWQYNGVGNLITVNGVAI